MPPLGRVETIDKRNVDREDRRERERENKPE
jgi:hypothetical protein